jgi:hypothetical protein
MGDGGDRRLRLGLHRDRLVRVIALYHRGGCSAVARAVHGADHLMIFLLIAGDGPRLGRRVCPTSRSSAGSIGGRGIFECDDVVGGQPVRVRYTWFVDETEPRFEPAFCGDGGRGRTWATNWITTQRRR